MNGWTPERRARQAELIRQWRPWEHSTGARTPEGKAKASQNARKPMTPSKLMKLARTDLKAAREGLHSYMDTLKANQTKEAKQ